MDKKPELKQCEHGSWYTDNTPNFDRCSWCQNPSMTWEEAARGAIESKSAFHKRLLDELASR